jgi:hypothetical protein
MPRRCAGTDAEARDRYGFAASSVDFHSAARASWPLPGSAAFHAV